MSPPSARSVSMRTAVCTVMCKLPAMRAPLNMDLSYLSRQDCKNPPKEANCQSSFDPLKPILILNSQPNQAFPPRQAQYSCAQSPQGTHPPPCTANARILTSSKANSNFSFPAQPTNQPKKNTKKTKTTCVSNSNSILPQTHPHSLHETTKEKRHIATRRCQPIASKPVPSQSTESTQASKQASKQTPLFSANIPSIPSSSVLYRFAGATSLPRIAVRTEEYDLRSWLICCEVGPEGWVEGSWRVLLVCFGNCRRVCWCGIGVGLGFSLVFVSFVVFFLFFFFRKVMRVVARWSLL